MKNAAIKNAVKALDNQKPLKGVPDQKTQHPYWEYLPWLVVGLGVAYLLWGVISASTFRGQMRLGDAAALPVLHNGREQPLDTTARVNLIASQAKSGRCKSDPTLLA